MDVEKILGGLMKSGLRVSKKKKKSKLLKYGLRSSTRMFSRGAKSLGKGGSSKLGLGILGVALAAYEHYNEQQKAQQSTASGTPSYSPQGRSSTPPPPPQRRDTTSPEHPSQIHSRQAENQPLSQEEQLREEQLLRENALLLIRAMIAAANADGRIDEEERSRILDYFQEGSLTDEERHFLTRELLNPSSLDDIVKQVDAPELARQVYASSLMAIDVDTEEEYRYLEELAKRLNLDHNTVLQIQEELELEEIR